MVCRKRGEEREMGGGLGRAVAGAFSLAAHRSERRNPLHPWQDLAVANAVEPPHCDGSTFLHPVEKSNYNDKGMSILFN